MVQLTVQQALHLLELQPGATTEQIRAAYKRLALRYHPDKQQLHFRWPTVNAATAQQQTRFSKPNDSTPQATAASFSLLSAAYQLLTSTSSPPQHSDPHSNNISNSFPSFEAAYASGRLFTEQLLDEAVVSGASPAEISSLQQYATAAATGQLAEALKQQPPTAEDEQLWRQLYKQLTVRWQLQQQQQLGQASAARKPATGGLLAELLSDVLLRPVGDQLVEVSDDPLCEELPPGEPEPIGAANAASAARRRGSAHSDSSKCHDSCDHQQGQAAHGSAPRQQHQQQQELSRQSSNGRSSSGDRIQKRRLRRGLGFYWTWFRRLLVAKAVVTILLSGRARAADYQAGLFHGDFVF